MYLTIFFYNEEGDIMFILCKRLKSLRINNNYTQEQLGLKLHLSKTSISNYENEKRMISIDTLVTMSRLYKVDLNYLVGMEENVKINNKEIVKMSTEEYEIIQELRNHRKLYIDLINNMNNTIKLIENKLYY